MFRRKRRAESDEAADDAAVADAPVEDAAEAPERPRGPWDLADLPEDDLTRVDLGALRVPTLPGTELRLEVDDQGRPVAVTVAASGSTVQLTVFAAPRTDGIWPEVRQEVATGLQGSGGAAEEADGPFGTELRARVPGEVPGRGRGFAPARFIGVDGPRWFLRAVITGPAVEDPEQAQVLEEVVRQVVVVRGEDPRPVREPLTLVLPPEVQEQAQQRAAQLRQARAASQAQEQAAVRAQQEAAQREISRRAQEAAAGGGGQGTAAGGGGQGTPAGGAAQAPPPRPPSPGEPPASA